MRYASLLPIFLGILMLSSRCISGLCFGGASRNDSQKGADLFLSCVNFRVSSHIDGNINLSDHETLTMQNLSYTLTDAITAQDDALIVVKNTNLTLSPPNIGSPSIVLRMRARLLVIDSYVNFSVADCRIVVQDNAVANITRSRLIGWGTVMGHGASEIYIYESDIHNSAYMMRSPSVATFDDSMIEVQSSNADGVYIWNSSTASINKSNASLIRSAVDVSEKTVINITDSLVHSIETSDGAAALHITNSTSDSIAHFGTNTYAWLENSSIWRVEAAGNTTVWLIDSSVTEISLEGDATVLIGTYWPVIGLVGVPTFLIPIIQVISILVIIGGIAAVAYAFYRKRALMNKDPKRSI